MTTDFNITTYFKDLDVKMNPSTQMIWDLIDGQLLEVWSADETLAEQYEEYYFLHWHGGEPYGAYCLRFDEPQLKEYVYGLVKNMDEHFLDEELTRDAAQEKRKYVALLSEDLFFEPKEPIDWSLLERKTNWALTQAIKEEEKRERETEERRQKEEQAFLAEQASKKQTA